jgi:hypothetical protein
MTAPAEEHKETGQIFYDSWVASLGWQFRGIQLPPWGGLYQGEQDAFRLAAHEAIKKGWAEAAPSPPGRHKRR